MDYVPGTEELEARSLRLPRDAWEEIEARAQAEARKPLDWLRAKIYEHILSNRARRQGAARPRRAA